MKVKGPDFYIRPFTGKQRRFTMRSGVLTSISSRQRSAISGRPFHERMGFAFLNNTALYIGGVIIIIMVRKMSDQMISSG